MLVINALALLAAVDPDTVEGKAARCVRAACTRGRAGCGFRFYSSIQPAMGALAVGAV